MEEPSRRTIKKTKNGERGGVHVKNYLFFNIKVDWGGDFAAVSTSNLSIPPAGT